MIYSFDPGVPRLAVGGWRYPSCRDMQDQSTERVLVSWRRTSSSRRPTCPRRGSTEITGRPAVRNWVGRRFRTRGGGRGTEQAGGGSVGSTRGSIRRVDTPLRQCNEEFE